MHINWNTWLNMRRRCSDPSNNRYKYYGAKGVSVCIEWDKSFKKFCEDMGDRPSKKHSIERIDISMGYYKENCVWATPTEQARNKSTSIYCVYKGEGMTLIEASIKSGVSYKKLHARHSRGIVGEDIFKKIKSNIKHVVVINGEEFAVCDISKKNGINPVVARTRIRRGWSSIDACTILPK